MTSSIVRSALLCLLVPCLLRSQDDSAFVNDPFQARVEREDLYGQLPPSESSPYPDLTDSSADGTRFTFRSRTEAVLSLPAGYTDGAYPGSPLHSLQKLTCRREGKFQAGFLMEKDPGESSFTDFTAFHLLMTSQGLLRSLILGDYILEIGEGIALWRQCEYTKGRDAIAPVRRHGRVIVPCLSGGAQNYLSGAAAVIGTAQQTAVIFWSRRLLSAHLDGDGNVESFVTDDLFRTPAERRSRDNTKEQIIGVCGTAEMSSSGRIGALLYQSVFDRPLRLRTPGIAGTSFGVLSVFGECRTGKFQTRGEWMMSDGKGGGILTLLLFPVSSIRCAASLRFYRHDWFSQHGAGFGEGSAGTDEEGGYLGITCTPLRSIRVNAFFDRFLFPPASPAAPFQKKGEEWETALDLIPSAGIRCCAEVHRKIGADGTGSVRTQYRLGLNAALSQAVSAGGRIDFLGLEYSGTGASADGRLVSADLLIDPHGPLQTDFRLCLFRTDSYDARITEYEHSFDGALSIPTFYGEGVKWYLLVKYPLTQRCTISARYSDLQRDDVLRIGTGEDRLPANMDERWGLQIDYSL